MCGGKATLGRFDASCPIVILLLFPYPFLPSALSVTVLERRWIREKKSGRAPLLVTREREREKRRRAHCEGAHSRVHVLCETILKSSQGKKAYHGFLQTNHHFDTKESLWFDVHAAYPTVDAFDKQHDIRRWKLSGNDLSFIDINVEISISDETELSARACFLRINACSSSEECAVSSKMYLIS